MPILQTKYEEACKLFEAEEYNACFEIVQKELMESPTNSRFLFLFSRILLFAENYEDAFPILTRLLDENPDDMEVCYCLVTGLMKTGSHKHIAIARDILFEILSRPSEDNRTDFMRVAATCCSMIGPLDKSVELWRMIVRQEETADNYYRLSDALAHTDCLTESLECLQRAACLDPKYNNLLDEYSSRNISESRPDLKRGRYPDTNLIQHDLKRVILDFVAADLQNVPKFISKGTRFFTMGSCFAKNIAKALQKRSFHADYLGITEQVNSTYANRYFVDFLADKLPESSPLSKRFYGLIGEHYTVNELNELLITCDVFILTLGVAPCFFDSETAKFVMPRPTALNSRALAEKYRFRTTSVAENVNNVVYLLSYVRKINPSVKIIISESPVPLHMTFEFRSAIMADCLSKSTLRVAAHEIVNNSDLKEIYYWPSFEIFRWLGCHIANPVYGTDDGASWHVSEDLVNLTMECFIEMFSNA
ncbi:MAG: GSCFA domain-containing protein [Geobacteraceae bacterium]|nr:GSCFA domain-containing protein [Geobacteraceae bacterium]